MRRDNTLPSHGTTANPHTAPLPTPQPPLHNTRIGTLFPPVSPITQSQPLEYHQNTTHALPHHLPLKQGLRQKISLLFLIFSRVLPHHLPLKQGLRPYLDGRLPAGEGLAPTPSSTQTRIKTSPDRTGKTCERPPTPSSTQTRIKTSARQRRWPRTAHPPTPSSTQTRIKTSRVS